MSNAPNLNCVRPIIFESENDEYPYFLGGTAFVVMHRDLPFVVTAKHCIDKTAVCKVDKDKVDKLRIPVKYQSGNREFFTFSRVFSACAPKEEADFYFADLVCIAITATGLENTFDPSLSIQSDASWRNSLRIGVSTPLVVRGFPHELRIVDYDRKVIEERACVCEGALTTTSIGKHCYNMQYATKAPVQDENGFSGSPVFSMRTGHLGGIVIRSSRDGRTGINFIGREVIYDMLEKAAVELVSLNSKNPSM